MEYIELFNQFNQSLKQYADIILIIGITGILLKGLIIYLATR